MSRRLLLPFVALLLLAPSPRAHLESGQIWVTDFASDTIYIILPDTWQVAVGVPQALGVDGPGAVGLNLHGDMLIANFTTNEILEYDGVTTPVVVATAANGIAGPWGSNGLIIGPGEGNVYISNTTNNEILRLDHDFTNPTVIADAADGIVRPVAMVFMANGQMLVGNDGSGGDIVAVDALGSVSVWDNIAGTEVSAMTVRDNGDLFVLTNDASIYKYTDSDPLTRALLGQYGPAANGGLEFSPDFADLYHVNRISGEFRTIDPDTGVGVVRATVPGRPLSLAVTGSQYPHGVFAPFGEGLDGTGGVAPILESHDEPRIGQSGTLHLEEFVGGSLVYAFLGLGADELAIFGGDFHVDVSGQFFWMVRIFGAGGTPGVAGDGHVDVPFTLPNDPVLVGTVWYLQALGTDNGAVAGVSMSNCAVMYVGDAP